MAIRDKILLWVILSDWKFQTAVGFYGLNTVPGPPKEKLNLAKSDRF